MKGEMDRWPERVAVVGLGLMGGSLALAIRNRHPQIELIGIDRELRVLEAAERRGAIDRGSLSLRDGISQADLVVLATPVSTILELLPRLPPLIGRETVVTDLGSAKREICRAAHDLLPRHFVGGHPIVGSEEHGIEAARHDLLDDAVYALTPLHPALEKADHLARFLGTLNVRVLFLEPERHDRVVAATSHLPQLLAVALAGQIGAWSAEDPLYGELTSGGLLDMTRVASSPYQIWRGILAANRAEIERALAAFIETLHELRGELRRGDLGEAFERAQRFRGLKD